MRPQELPKACDRNYAAAFAALIPHAAASVCGTGSFERVEAVVTGLSGAFYNPQFVTDDDALADNVSAAVRWIRSRGVAASVQLRHELQSRLSRSDEVWALSPIHGSRRHGALADPTYPRPPAELRLERVGFNVFEDWHIGISYAASFRRVYGATLLDDRRFRLIVGCVDNEPVTGAAVIVSDGVAGIYAVGTAERARRRDFGRATTWQQSRPELKRGAPSPFSSPAKSP